MDLIDRDALKEEVESLQIQITGIRSGKMFILTCMDGYKKSILKIIDEAPSIIYGKSLPKKVTERKVIRSFSGIPIQITGKCPVCGCPVKADQTDYCMACGQKLDWDGDL